MFLRIILTVGVFTIFSVSAFAQTVTPKSLGVFSAWSAYTLTENGQQTCYMVAKAHEGKSKFRRGPAWLTITQRPGENSKDVISYTSGYNFKAGSDADMRIGREHFDLFTLKDAAWSRDARTDHAITAAIQKNISLSVTGISAAHGAKPVTDAVDLRGGTNAYHAITRACGMEPPLVARPVPPKKKAGK